VIYLDDFVVSCVMMKHKLQLFPPNKKLLEEVVKDGRVFISSTMLDGKFTLRFACLAFRTHLKTVDILLEVLKEKVKLLQRDQDIINC